jgi:hypothetical protein
MDSHIKMEVGGEDSPIGFHSVIGHACDYARAAYFPKLDVCFTPESGHKTG